ncbi:MAG: hypothetical protein KBA91_01490 [Candidatus Moranbacteria bacterium]|nr:hypothetical protein [Candidatus Moranbacteria bacterium]
MGTSRRKHTIMSLTLQGGSHELTGSVQLFVLGVLTTLFVSGACYLYAVNQSAVQGYHMRTLEKEIGALKQKNAELRIAEADLRSLSRLESSQEELQLQKLENIKYLEVPGLTSPAVVSQEHFISASFGGPLALK